MTVVLREIDRPPTDVTGLHEALDAQAESERRLRTTIGNIPGMVYRSQAVAPWSDELIAGGDVSVTGYSVEELTDADFRWVDIMDPEDVPRLDEATRAAGDAGRGAAEYRIRTKDGGSAGCSTASRWSPTRRATPSHRKASFSYVTDQHLIEDELRASRRELELHAAIATIFLTVPPDQMFTEVLRVVREALGGRWGFFGYLDRDGSLVAPSLDAEVWDACRVEGKTQRFPEETWSDNTWSRAIRTGQTQVLASQGVVPEGHLPVSRAVATPIVHGEETIGLFILAERETDFTDEDVHLLKSIAASTAPVLHEWRERHHHEAARVEAERALRESEQRYRALYDGSTGRGVRLRPRPRLPRLQPGVRGDPRRTHRPPPRQAHRSVLGRTWPILQAIQQAAQGNERLYEGPHTTSTGRTLWLTLKAAPRHDADGNIIGATGVIVDRTRQKESEDKIRHLLLHDSATGLADATLFEERTSQALKHAQRRRLALSVAVFHVDRFDDRSRLSRALDDAERLLEELGLPAAARRAGRGHDRVPGWRRLRCTAGRSRRGRPRRPPPSSSYPRPPSPRPADARARMTSSSR